VLVGLDIKTNETQFSYWQPAATVLHSSDEVGERLQRPLSGWQNCKFYPQHW